MERSYAANPCNRRENAYAADAASTAATLVQAPQPNPLEVPMTLASQSTRTERAASKSKFRSSARVLLATPLLLGAIGWMLWMRNDQADSSSTFSMSLQRTASAAVPTEPNFASNGETRERRSALDDAMALAGTALRTEPVQAEPADPTPTGPAKVDPPTATPTAAPTVPPTTTPPAPTKPESTPDPKKDEPAKDGANPDASKQDAKPALKPDATTPDTAKPTEGTPDKRTPPYFGNGFNGSGTTQPPAVAAPPAGSPVASLREGLALAATEPVKARLLLSQALLSGALDESDAQHAANALSRLSAQLFLTPVFNASDAACFQYTVAPNDSLERIVRKQKLGCDWRLVALMNNIKKPELIQVGKRLKMPKGPFSAVISKRDYRLDICMGVGSDRIIVATMPIGLGEANGTPNGRFRVRAGSKLINPEWTHPVSGQRFEADDPANPIGEHWLGLEGIDESNAKLAGYGIHGTIDNDSIGHDRSLGCVRLLSSDVALVWAALADGAEVEIR